MDGKNYSAVPPPPSLTASSESSSVAAPLDFNDALSKARAIAEKLKQQSSGGEAPAAASSSGAPYSSSSGTKRGYNDDDRDDYRSSSTRSHGSSYDDRDSKRSAYDSGSSRPSYGGDSSRRYGGLGSDERKPSYHGSGGGQHQEDYSVPNHMVGLLIGKGGENLKKIERMSGVSKVQFSNDTSGPERQVHLTGAPDQVAIARDMIRQMVDDAQNNGPGHQQQHYGGGSGAYGGYHQGGNAVTISIPVPKVGLVIGRGGETIRDFEERSKAKILISSDGTGDQNNERTIKLVGDEQATAMAKQLIEDIVYGSNSMNNANAYGAGVQSHYGQPPNSNYGVNRMGRSDDERIFVTVPASAVGLIIGRGGETVRALQEQSGARVKVDPSTDPNAEERTVNISGDPRCVAIAKQLVEDKVAEASRGGNRRHHNRHQQQQDYYGNDNSGGYDYSQYYNQQQQYGYGGYQQQQGGEEGKEGGEQSNMDPAAYYAQYYSNMQQQTPEQQQAYYQWYQQYYGNQQQHYQQQQQQGGNENNNDNDNSNENYNSTENYNNNDKENVDGEPLDTNDDSKRDDRKGDE